MRPVSLIPPAVTMYAGSLVLLSCLCGAALASPLVAPNDDVHIPLSRVTRDVTNEGGAIDWNALAHEELARTQAFKPDYSKAKNVVFFIGDGMGPATVTASRVYMGQTRGQEDVKTSLNWEDFPVTGLSKIPNADRRVPDSAATATAMLCGEKANFYTVGVNDKVKLFNCSNVEGNRLRSSLKYALDVGKWVGVVTTTRITHATPAAAYASSAGRDWEAEVPEDTSGRDQCPDIAHQLVHGVDSRKFRVFLGGGQRSFYPNNVTVPHGDSNGKRTDGRDLVQEWKDMKASMGVSADRYKYVTDKAGFDAVDAGRTDYLLGLFSVSHMSYELHRQQQNPIQEPSLAEMVEKAINILKRSPKGFILLVEGGRIDTAHHDSQAHLALAETVALHDATTKATEMTDVSDTLTVVTADHSHTMTIGGYPNVNTDILGTHIDLAYNEPMDGMPYTILGYHNGPGWFAHRLDGDGQPINRNVTGIDAPITRINITDQNTTVDDYVFDAGIPGDSETHGGEDVAIYAQGPSAYLFSGVHQQHYIAHAVMTAACLGPYSDLEDCPTSAALKLGQHGCTLSLLSILMCCVNYLAVHS